MKDLLKRMLLVLGLLYLALLTFAFFFSERLIFQPHPSSYADNSEILKIKSANGNTISAIYLFNPAARFTLLVSHGNAEDLGDDRYWLEDLRRDGFNVLAYDYQGYGTSQGKPTEKTTYDDEAAAYDFLAIQLGTPPDRIIIFGRSIGSGPAVHIAVRRPSAGLILQSPFVSAFRVLTRVPLLPFDKFPNLSQIRHIHCPLLVIHGLNDGVIGTWHGKKIYQAANQPKQFLWVQGADHNDVDVIAGAAYLEAIRSFASSLQKRDSATTTGR